MASTSENPPANRQPDISSRADGFLSGCQPSVVRFPGDAAHLPLSPGTTATIAH